MSTYDLRRRGYFGIGIWHPKTEHNVGTLWRSCESFDADFMFTVGRRYREQGSDTVKAWRHRPLYHFTTLDDLRDHLPYSCQLIGVELAPGAQDLPRYRHPERACYLLGAEDHGLTEGVLSECHAVVTIPCAGRCLNVAVAGSIVLYDRTANRQLLRVGVAA